MVTAPTIVYSRHAQGGNTAFACGKVTVSADGGSTDISLILGFVPSMFEIINTTGVIIMKWHAGLASGAYLKSIAVGTHSLETSGGPAVLSSGSAGYGITIPNALFTNSDVLYFEAHP